MCAPFQSTADQNDVVAAHLSYCEPVLFPSRRELVHTPIGSIPLVSFEDPQREDKTRSGGAIWEDVGLSCSLVHSGYCESVHRGLGS